MNPLQFTRNVRSLNRLRQIAQVLTQHGFGYVVARIQLGRYLPGWARRRRPPREELALPPATIGRQLRAVCTELGPTFIKFAQLLSTRPDVLPAEIVSELSELQDRVPPFDTDVAFQIIARQLGKPIDQCFAEIDRVPIASGSIGQVHRARGPKGEALVVKVRRPGLEQIVNVDMELLHWLAESLERFLPELRVYRPSMIVTEFEDVLNRELDFVNEGAAAAAVGKAFADSPHVHIPRVYWEWSGAEVLTLEALPGTSLRQILAGDAPSPGWDRPALARRLVEAYLTQIFDIGRFHADPHPGNLLIEQPATLGLIDFGQVGTITDEMVTHLVVLLYAAVRREMDLAVAELAELGVLGPETDRRQLQRDLRQLVDKYHGLAIKHVDLNQLFHEFAQVVRAHDVLLPRELPMLVKALALVAQTSQQLDPSLDVLELLRPRLRKAWRDRLHPRQIGRAAAKAGWQALALLREAPLQVQQTLRHLAAGTWQFNLKHQNIDRLVSELDQSSNRLSFAMIIAAIIVGSSVVVTSAPELTVLGVPLQYFGVVGYLVAGVFGIALAWSIFRSGRFDAILQEMHGEVEIDQELWCIDGTVVRAARSAAGGGRKTGSSRNSVMNPIIYQWRGRP